MTGAYSSSNHGSRDLAAVHVGPRSCIARIPQASTASASTGSPTGREPDPRPDRSVERHPLAEQPLMVLERQVGHPDVARQAHPRWTSVT